MVLDEANMSDTTLLVSVEDLINMAMGPSEGNCVDFKMVQTILHILARQMRLLEQKVVLEVGELPPPPVLKPPKSKTPPTTTSTSTDTDKQRGTARKREDDIQEEPEGRPSSGKRRHSRSGSRDMEKDRGRSVERDGVRDKSKGREEKAEREARKEREKYDKMSSEEREQSDREAQKEKEKHDKMSPKEKEKAEKEAQKEKEKYDKMSPQEKEKADREAQKEKEKHDKMSPKEREKAEKEAQKEKEKYDKMSPQEKEKADREVQKEKEKYDKMSPKEREKAEKEAQKEKEKYDKMSPQEKEKADREVQKEKEKYDKMSPKEREKAEKEAQKEKEKYDKMSPQEKEKADREVQKEKEKYDKMSPKEREKAEKEAQKEKEKYDKMSPQEKEKADREVQKEKEKYDKMSPKEREKAEKEAQKEKEKYDKMSPQEKEKADREVQKEKEKYDKMSPKEREKAEKEAQKEKEKYDKMSPQEKEKADREVQKEKEKYDKMSPKEREKVEKEAQKEKEKYDKMSPKEKEKAEREAQKEKEKYDKMSPKEREKAEKEARKEKEKYEKMSPKEREKADQEAQKEKEKAEQRGSIVVSEVATKTKEKVLVVEKGPTTRSAEGGRGGRGGGSIEVVTRSQFALLEAAVAALKEGAGPLPPLTLPDNKQLRSDLARGSVSLTDAMQAMQVAARVQAAEAAIGRLGGLLTQLAAHGGAGVSAALADLDDDEDVLERLPQQSMDTRRPSTVSHKSVMIQAKLTKGEGGQGGQGSKHQSVSSVASRVSAKPSATSRGTLTGTGHVTHPQMNDALQNMRDDLMRNVQMMTNRANSAADTASNFAKSVAEKLEVALSLDSRIKGLQSLVADYAEQLSGFDAGLTTQMQSFQEQMLQMRVDLTGGLAQLDNANNNAETAAVMELTERYDLLVVDLDQTLLAHQALTSFQEQLSVDFRSLLECVEMLREQKADRDEVLDGLRDKADNERLAGLLREEDFEEARAELERRLDMCHDKFRRQDAVWVAAIKDLTTVVQTKAELMELLKTRDETTVQLQEIQNMIKKLAMVLGEPKAAMLMRRLARGALCGACLVPALMDPAEPAAGRPPALPAALPALGARQPPVGAEGPCEPDWKPPETPDLRTHICHRWVGGSHTLLDAAARRRAGALPVLPTVTKKYLGQGNDGRLYNMEAELEPCRECNAEEADAPAPPGAGGDGADQDPRRRTVAGEPTDGNADPRRRTAAGEPTDGNADPRRRTIAFEPTDGNADPRRRTVAGEPTDGNADPVVQDKMPD